MKKMKNNITTKSFTKEDIKILNKIYEDHDINTAEKAVIAFQAGLFVYESPVGDYTAVYKNHQEFEKSFDEEFRDDISFEAFIKEFELGYGESNHTQIARLFTLSCGIFYDNEY